MSDINELSEAFEIIKKHDEEIRNTVINEVQTYVLSDEFKFEIIRSNEPIQVAIYMFLEHLRNKEPKE